MAGTRGGGSVEGDRHVSSSVCRVCGNSYLIHEPKERISCWVGHRTGRGAATERWNSYSSIEVVAETREILSPRLWHSTDLKPFGKVLMAAGGGRRREGEGTFRLGQARGRM